MILLTSLAVALATIPGDARRGEELFTSQRCTACHGKTAPNLKRPLGRDFTPSLLASLLWNHAPQMWQAMEGAGIARPSLTEQQAADLFAFFYAFRYFEQPGDAARGRRAFEEKRCSACHSLKRPGKEGAPPVTEWEALTDPLQLARAMWDHAGQMRESYRRRGYSWPTLTPQQLTDVVVYVRAIPRAVNPGEERFSLSQTEFGEEIFRIKGCIRCHQGALAMHGRFRNRTLTGFAVEMWNHAPKMAQPPPQLSAEEMRRVVAYLWSVQYFDEPGNAKRGAKVFAANRCGECHSGPTWFAPSLAKRAQPLDSILVISTLWRHGPAMLAEMQKRHIRWPRFRRTDLSDLIA